MPRHPETWIGRWRKEGHISPNLDSRDIIKCKYCQEDQAARQRNYRLNRKLRSYRVIGVTKPGSMWEWQEGVCQNPDRCWGNKTRFWTVLKSSGDQWVFRTEISELNDPLRSSNIDELRVNLNQGNGPDRLLYSGIATGRKCNSFWPLIPGDTTFPARKIVIKMRSGEPMPPNGNRFELRYMFPNHIIMRFFEQPQKRLQSGICIADKPTYPESEEALEESWNEIREALRIKT